MQFLPSLRTRTALVGVAASLLALGAQALPAAAASETSKAISFTITSNDVTNFDKGCPPGTNRTQVMLCGYGVDEPVMQATNTGGDAGLSGTQIKESFVSLLDYPVATANCPALSPTLPGQMKNYSAVTLKTTTGNIFLVTHDGAYCTTTNSDVEPFTVLGGTGAYSGATGSGVINAYANAAQTATPGFAHETYTGTITLAGK
jgi:hypothetical protein